MPWQIPPVPGARCADSSTARCLRRSFSFKELAGEPVVIVNIATKCSEVDRNYEDLRLVR